jgi:hypothetical protein
VAAFLFVPGAYADLSTGLPWIYRQGLRYARLANQKS